VISYLNGKVLKKFNDFVIFLTTSGIGFKVITPYPEDIEKEVYIYQIISEKENSLYGFNSYEEVEFFENKISKGEMLLVKGVRKKVLDDIYKYLSKEREEIAISDNKTKDLIKILLSLGFEKDDIFETLKKIDDKEKISIEEYVKKALRILKNE